LKQFRGLGIAARVGIVIGLLGIGGAAATGAVVLPSNANDHATSSTTEVTTGTPTGAPSVEGTPTSEGTPAPQASFGQCVAANAKTASENGGQGWNPTQGCTKPGPAGSQANGVASRSNNAAAGADNGAANTNGAEHAAARGGNAGSHP
jgi:hypothetical protein